MRGSLTLVSILCFVTCRTDVMQVLKETRDAIVASIHALFPLLLLLVLHPWAQLQSLPTVLGLNAG